ncbi:very short patch repair endonuclease [Bradyrhizobium sp. NBAIM14]|uniref:very short patch repair endonuclease n=1 Tax=Bradyrhizobium sp. NBAIM14 TaxID=2793814 RepID=UPI001CD31267
MNSGKRSEKVSPTTSARMKRVRRQGTDLELLVRRYLWQQGVRFSVNTRGLPGSPDIANRRRRWAVFINGCFWHGHEGCGLARLPNTNRAFWSRKVDDNRRRDAAKVKQLRAQGFLVITVWGCEIKHLVKTGHSSVLNRFVRKLKSRPPSN